MSVGTQVADTVNWIHGNHSIKFGGDYIHTYDLINNLFAQYGGYSYSTLTNYLTDLYLSQNPQTVSQAHNYSSYTQGFGRPGLDFNYRRLCFLCSGRVEVESAPEPDRWSSAMSMNSCPRQ